MLYKLTLLDLSGDYKKVSACSHLGFYKNEYIVEGDFIFPIHTEVGIGEHLNKFKGIALQSFCS